MRREKAFLPSEGTGCKTLLSRQVELLQEIGLSEVLVSLRRGMISPDPGLKVIHDETEGLGPLSGIVAAMRLAPDNHLLVLAVDLGCIDAHFLRAVIARSSDSSGAAPRALGRWEPLCAVYPPHALPSAEAVLASPRRSPSALIALLEREGVMNGYLVSTGEQYGLRSWNLPEDLPASVRYRSEYIP
jgi:molybdopterin-guanine dinucleotide biosynthesis protein A